MRQWMVIFLMLLGSNVYSARTRINLYEAVEEHDVARIEDLLADGKHPDGDNPCKIPLIKAVELGDVRIAEILLVNWLNGFQKANINIAERGTGRTPLFVAVQKSNIEMARFLLEKGANPDGNDDSNPLLEIASQRCGYTSSMIKLLLSHGANLDKKLGDGKTVLEVIKERNSCGCFIAIVKEWGIEQLKKQPSIILRHVYGKKHRLFKPY